MDEMHFLRHVNDIRDLSEIETILDRLSIQWDNGFDDYQYDTNDEMIEALKKDEDFVIFNIKDFMDDLKPLMILIDKLEDECDRDEDEDNYEEYKAYICDNKLKERGDACFTIHKAAEESKTGKEWSHGYPERFYRNDLGFLCIRYADDEIFTYKFMPDGLKWEQK